MQRRSIRLAEEREVDPLLSLKTFGNPALGFPPPLKRLPIFGILSPPASPPRKIRVCGISSSGLPSLPQVYPVFVLAPASLPLCISLTPSNASSPAKENHEKKIGSPRGSNLCGISAMDALLNVISRVSPDSRKSTLNPQIQHTPIHTDFPRISHSIMSTNVDACEETMNHSACLGGGSNAATQVVSLMEDPTTDFKQPLQPQQVRFQL